MPRKSAGSSAIAAPPRPDDSLAFDIPALVQATCLGERTLRRMDAGGEIPGRFMVGRRVLFRAPVVRAWVTAGMPAPSQWNELGITTGGGR